MVGGSAERNLVEGVWTLQTLYTEGPKPERYNCCATRRSQLTDFPMRSSTIKCGKINSRIWLTMGLGVSFDFFRLCPWQWLHYVEQFENCTSCWRISNSFRFNVWRCLWAPKIPVSCIVEAKVRSLNNRPVSCSSRDYVSPEHWKKNESLDRI